MWVKGIWKKCFKVLSWAINEFRVTLWSSINLRWRKGSFNCWRKVSFIRNKIVRRNREVSLCTRRTCFLIIWIGLLFANSIWKKRKLRPILGLLIRRPKVLIRETRRSPKWSLELESNILSLSRSIWMVFWIAIKSKVIEC